MLQDKERVTKRFLEAAEKGIVVRKSSLSCQDLVHHLSKSGPIILLTDASLLHCDICKVNKLTSELRGCLPWSASYTGVYDNNVASASASAAFDKDVLYFQITYSYYIRYKHDISHIQLLHQAADLVFFLKPYISNL
jgi:hypothetical protein